MSSSGWIGFDLDGTLAEYDGFRGPGMIGEPIRPMIELVKKYLSEGYQVKIMTARVWHDNTPRRVAEAMTAREAIIEWCGKHIGVELPVTYAKDYGMFALFDDRAIHVVKNLGLFNFGDADRVFGRTPTP